MGRQPFACRQTDRHSAVVVDADDRARTTSLNPDLGRRNAATIPVVAPSSSAPKLVSGNKRPTAPGTPIPRFAWLGPLRPLQRPRPHLHAAAHLVARRPAA